MSRRALGRRRQRAAQRLCVPVRLSPQLRRGGAIFGEESLVRGSKRLAVPSQIAVGLADVEEQLRRGDPRVGILVARQRRLVLPLVEQAVSLAQRPSRRLAVPIGLGGKRRRAEEREQHRHVGERSPQQARPRVALRD